VIRAREPDAEGFVEHGDGVNVFYEVFGEGPDAVCLLPPPETLIPATIGFEMYEREEALALAATMRCPVLITQNGGGAFWPKDTSGPLAEATGGRLHVFEGLGPIVGARWPVAMNLVLRDFFASAAEGA
jgi:hypothetical protein